MSLLKPAVALLAALSFAAIPVAAFAADTTMQQGGAMKSDDKMMKSDDKGAMKSDDKMMKSDDKGAMKSDDKMMKSDDKMMKK